MVAQPGRLQSGFTAGELSPTLHDRTTLKYFTTGVDMMINAETIPQGGFTLSGGLKHVATVTADDVKIVPFNASTGAVFDIVIRPGAFSVYQSDDLRHSGSITGLTSAMMERLNYAQKGDTLLLFHPDLKTKRIRYVGLSQWPVDDAPFENIMSYDFGGPIGGGNYTNGVAAQHQIEFLGFETGTTRFTLTVSNETTETITFTSDMVALAELIKTQIEALPNVGDGIDVVSQSGDATGNKILILFSGTDNTGDGWAVSGEAINKSDAALISFKTQAGLSPGEPLFSNDRGWPSCGVFYAQRLLLGGFKSLPNAWAYSIINAEYNFDTDLSSASGAALVPMDIAGGERVERIIAGQNLLVFTTNAEYWLAERTLSKTDIPNHVQGSNHGLKPGAPVVQSEGAALFCNTSGGFLGEFRYADIDGNYSTLPLSLLAGHLVKNISAMSMRKQRLSTDGNTLHCVTSDGKAINAILLREQEVTAFMQRHTTGSFVTVATNMDNQTSYLVNRNGVRSLERVDDDLLLDEARHFENETPTNIITGMGGLAGKTIWVIADDHVLGPFNHEGTTITLPIAVSSGYAGTWTPPVVKLLPPPRDIGPGVVLRKRARIHTAHISVLDTTSVAIQVNDQKPIDLPLNRYDETANVPELQNGKTGIFKRRGLTGFRDAPQLTITQVRPGRLTVRSTTIEVDL